MELIAVYAGLVISVILGYCLMGSRISYWREKALESKLRYDDIMQRAIRAEQEEARTKDELVRWQQTIYSLQGRPVIATLNDAQAQALINAMQMFLSTNKSGTN